MACITQRCAISYVQLTIVNHNVIEWIFLTKLRYDWNEFLIFRTWISRLIVRHKKNVGDQSINRMKQYIIIFFFLLTKFIDWLLGVSIGGQLTSIIQLMSIQFVFIFFFRILIFDINNGTTSCSHCNFWRRIFIAHTLSYPLDSYLVLFLTSVCL